MVAMDPQSKARLDNWGGMKQARMGREARWAEVARFCEPGEDFTDDRTLLLSGGSDARRKVFTGLGELYAKRCGGFLMSYLIDHTKPFMSASLEAPADVSAGFVTMNRLGQESKEYLSSTSWQMFYEIMRPGSGFHASTAHAIRSFVQYGPGIKFSTLNAKGAARFKHCPIKSCWIRRNEEGQVDTLYRLSYFYLYRLVSLYPQALGHERIRKLHEGEKSSLALIAVIHAVEPRQGGVVGAEARGKPFSSVWLLPDYDGHMLKEEGFDTFPYSVAANEYTEGNPYGRGLSEACLPELEAINHYQAGVENNVDLINEPPILYANGLFEQYSFEAGSATGYDAYAVPYGTLREAVMQMPVAGNISVAMGYIDWLEKRVGETHFTDWMKLREKGTMTATEVNDTRDLRVRGISALVPGMDRDMFGAEMDRVMDLKLRRRLLPPYPAEFVGRTLSWDYDGPLAQALKATASDVQGQVIALYQSLVKEAPEVADIIDIEAVIRNWADKKGAEPETLRSAEEVKRRQDKRRADEDAQREAEMASKSAAAMRDGAQGVASMVNAGDGRGADIAAEMTQKAMAA